MAGHDEPVTAPDQHKPGNRKVGYAGGIVTIVVMLVYLIGNHEGHVEDVFLLGIAGLIAVGLAGDWLLRRNGLKD